MGRILAVLALLACGVPRAGAQTGRWRVVYDYGNGARSALTLTDIAFPSSSRGVAVGTLVKGRSIKHVALLTSDGGSNWQIAPLKDTPLSLFFLNETAGWMVTERGLWKTVEAGKSWTKIFSTGSKITRVYFLDENTGWAVGPEKTASNTTDGGKHWKPLAAAGEPPGDPKTSQYSWVGFADPRAGMITGGNFPQSLRPNALPDWLDPASAMVRPELPHLGMLLTTADGGSQWKAQSVSMFGAISRFRFGPGSDGLALVEHNSSFPFPSEVFRLRRPRGESEVVFRSSQVYISDLWITPGGSQYLAGIAANSKLRGVVAQRVQVFRSTDYTTWTPMDVDYRAVANGVILAGSGEDLWAATNHGMILKLVR